MKEITVAELRQNPTAALVEVEAGETYVVTKHRRPVARLVPAEDGEVVSRLSPPRDPGPSALADRPRADLHTYEETEALLADLASEW